MGISEHLMEGMVVEEVTDVDICLKDLELYPDRTIEKIKREARRET